MTKIINIDDLIKEIYKTLPVHLLEKFVALYLILKESVILIEKLGLFPEIQESLKEKGLELRVREKFEL